MIEDPSHTLLVLLFKVAEVISGFATILGYLLVMTDITNPLTRRSYRLNTQGNNKIWWGGEILREERVTKDY